MDPEQGGTPPEGEESKDPVSLDAFRQKKREEMGPLGEAPTLAEIRRRIQLSGTEISPNSKWHQSDSGSNRWWQKIPEAIRKVFRRG